MTRKDCKNDQVGVMAEIIGIAILFGIAAVATFAAIYRASIGDSAQAMRDTFVMVAACAGIVVLLWHTRFEARLLRRNYRDKTPGD